MDEPTEVGRGGRKSGEISARREGVGVGVGGGGGGGGGEAARGLKVGSGGRRLGCGRNWGRAGAFRLRVRVKGVNVKLVHSFF